MPLSAGGLRLRKPRTVDLPRASDRVTYLFLDLVRIEQDQTGVIATWGSGESLSIPLSSLGVLMLGPGVSITAPAISTAGRSGCSIVFTDSIGASSYAAARPLSSRSSWLQAQARVWASPELRVRAAYSLYADRFSGIDLPGNAPLKVLRGIEGRRVRDEYQLLAAEYKLSNWRRESDSSKSTDGVNPLLNIGNAILYGVALTACNAIGLAPGLGIVHQGSASALLFDLADSYKRKCVMPAAFLVGSTSNSIPEFRNIVRKKIFDNKVLDGMLELSDLLFGDHVQSAESDTLLDETTQVPGHLNYHKVE